MFILYNTLWSHIVPTLAWPREWGATQVFSWWRKFTVKFKVLWILSWSKRTIIHKKQL